MRGPLALLYGNAAGGGYELALAADHIMLVDDRRSAVALPETPLLAVLPGTGGLTRVTDKRKVRRDLADVFATTAEGTIVYLGPSGEPESAEAPGQIVMRFEIPLQAIRAKPAGHQVSAVVRRPGGDPKRPAGIPVRSGDGMHELLVEPARVELDDVEAAAQMHVQSLDPLVPGAPFGAAPGDRRPRARTVAANVHG